MEEDINNEESNLMYPKIENVFYNIKSEPEDYDENEHESIELVEYESNDYYVPIPNKIILGSKPTTQASLQPAPETSVASEWAEENSFQCDECDAVLTTQEELEAHKTSHSYLVARPYSSILENILCTSDAQITSTPNVSQSREPREDTFNGTRRQKAIKSTAKSALLNKTFPIVKPANNAQLYSNADLATPQKIAPESDRFLCNHCDEHFPNEIALIKHTYELLPEKTFECDICEQGFNTSIAMRGHRAVHFRKQTKVAVHPDVAKKNFFQCPYCSCYLKHSVRISKHMLEKHNAKFQDTTPVKFIGKCMFCVRSMSNHMQYNRHIMKCHRKMYYSKIMLKSTASKASFKCKLCNEVFSSRYAAYKHKSLKHSHHKQKNTFETLQNAVPAQKPKSANMTSLTKNLSLIGAPIPKQTLFKCNKCQIHFVTCSTALEHSKRCVLVKGDWKCNKCRRTFTHSERPIHTLQHENSDKFKVHVVNDKLIRKVICCCPKCELHFDENAFWNHVSAGCVELKGVDCNICHLKMHPDSLFKHRKYHSKYNLTRADYIVVEFVDASTQNIQMAVPELESQKQIPKKRNQFNEEGKRNLYFCKNCKSHTYGRKYKNFHLTRDCQDRTYKKVHCPVCGLLFTDKIYRTQHVVDHTLRKLTLNDYSFMRLQDSKVINPPLPEFRKCDKCKVRFLNLVSKRWHSCKKQEWKKCDQCSHKYDPETYDVHMRFHEYGLEAAAPEKSLSEFDLYLYSCVTCNYGFDSYDSLVEHCQNHYTGTEFVKTSACNVCNLNYTGNAKRNHNLAHSNYTNFKILKFNYDKLLHEDWLEAFDGVPKEQIEEILSKSVYGNMRNIRLSLLTDGPPERSLYQCAQCGLSIEFNNIVEHTKEPCPRASKFHCDSCVSQFPTLDLANEHINIHVVFGDDISFRRIEFNHNKDKKLNEVLRAGRKKESLKFRKCQHCDLLIKKDEFQNHVEEHEKRKVENKIIQDKKERFTIYDTLNGLRRMYTVYQCVHCKSGIMKKSNIIRHSCGLLSSSEKCSKCSLYVRTFQMQKHQRIHVNLPKFVTKNITVLEFEIHSNVNSVSRNESYSLDDNKSDVSRKSDIAKPYDTRKRSDKFYADSPAESENSQDIDVEDIKTNEPKIIDSENVSTSQNSELELKSKLYQCDRCYMCFVYKDLLENHLKTCVPNSSEPPLACNRCDIILHPSLMEFHEKLHSLVSQNLFDNSLIIIHISSKGDPDTTQWLYQCKVCDVNFLSYKTLWYHFTQNHNYVNDYVACDLCGYKFTAATRTRHIRLQHEGNNCKDNISVEIVEKKAITNGEFTLSVREPSKDNEVTGEKSLRDETKVTDVSVQKCNEIDTSNTANTTIVDESIEELSEVHNASSQITFKLFKCLECNVHYINYNTLECHIRKSYRIHNTNFVECDLCGIKFGVYTLRKHKALHHLKCKNKRLNFTVTTLPNVLYMDEDDIKTNKGTNYAYLNTIANSNDEDISNVASTSQILEDLEENDSVSAIDVESIVDRDNVSINVKYASSIDTEDLPLTELGKPDVKEKQPKRIRIYQCIDCRICVEKNQRKLHVCCSDIQKKHCIKCSLSFRYTDFKQHVILHRKLNLSRRNLVLVKFGQRRVKNNKIFKCVKCSTHFVSINALEWHMAVWNHQTKRVLCEPCGLFFGKFSFNRHVYIHHNQLKLTSDQLDIVNVSTSDINPSGTQEIPDTSSNTSNVSENASVENDHQKPVKKLFKCFDCDVYFLTQVSYYAHMFKHTELDTTDYIACKICDMQFLTDDLGIHMKTHRDRSFDLANVVIEGYQANDGSPKIESYLAVDGLNSKLVSTTTPFVNENGTVSTNDEQLGTVDSTSAKLQ